MSETFDDADDRLLRELGIPQECPLSFGKPVLARRTVQPADLLVLAGPFDEAEVAGIEAVEVRALGIRAGESRQ
jgi:hypothetical protein